jgi:hypothetical protein
MNRHGEVEHRSYAITTQRGRQCLITYEHPYFVVYLGQGKSLRFASRVALDKYLERF